jgi:hypothetical protein
MADELAESQADLNEYLAYMIMGEAFNEPRYVDRALTALTNHNLAAGFGAEFAGEKPPDDLDGRQRCVRAAVNAVHFMDVMSRRDAIRARHEADDLQRWAPDGAVPLSTVGRRGARISHHPRETRRREGRHRGHVRVAPGATPPERLADPGGIPGERQVWPAAIETDVLKWWRGALGLPSYLTRDHMPQGGWTETVAAGPRRPGGNGDAHLQSGGCVAAPDACLTRAPRNSTPGPSRGVAKRRVKMI